MKATVLYVKDTGQVMAAVTRVALVEAAPADDPDAVSPEVLALAGGALPVRSFLDSATGLPDPATFAIPAKQLAALTLDVEDGQLLSPRNFMVVDDEKLEIPPATALPTVTPANSNGTLDVNLAAATTVELPVALHVLPVLGTGGRELHLQGVFKPGTPTQTKVSFNLTDPLYGQYAFLVLVRGYRPGIWRQSL